jgi:hypothetical protein
MMCSLCIQKDLHLPTVGTFRKSYFIPMATSTPNQMCNLHLKQGKFQDYYIENNIILLTIFFLKKTNKDSLGQASNIKQLTD